MFKGKNDRVKIRFGFVRKFKLGPSVLPHTTLFSLSDLPYFNNSSTSSKVLSLGTSNLFSFPAFVVKPMTFIVLQSAVSPLNERVLTRVSAFQVADLAFE